MTLSEARNSFKFIKKLKKEKEKMKVKLATVQK